MKRFHAQRGASMVEFAVVSSALFLLIFGLVEFGRMMYVYHSVANAARIGSRWAMVRGTTSCNGATGKALTTCPATSDEVKAYVQSVVPMDDSATLDVSVQWPGGIGCAKSSDHASAGCPVIVTARNDFYFAIPFVSSSTSKITISSTSQMAISQ